jgi:hypothetical protein
MTYRPPRNYLRNALRGAVIASIAFLCSLSLAAQDSGSVVFPTDGICHQNYFSIPSPSGRIDLYLGGRFASIRGTPTLTPCLNYAIQMNYVPYATQVSFTIKNFYFLSEDFTVTTSTGDVTYTLPPGGTQEVTDQGDRIGGTYVNASCLSCVGIMGMSITQPPPNTGFVTFDLRSSTPATSDETKILMSKAIWDIGFPSSVQIAPDNAGNPRMKISGTLLDAFTGVPKAGTVYLKVIDPPDTAPYRGGDAVNGDNDGAQAQLTGGSSGLSISMQTDQQGRFEATLLVNSRTAGDNYQIVGSATPNFTCIGVCPRTAVLTLWKRIYVEEEHMFKQGAFLNDVANAGGTEIPIDDATPFQNLAPGTTLELIHADSGIGEGFYFDFVTFKSTHQRSNGKWVIDIDPASEFSRDYGAPPPQGAANQYLELMRDGVGIVDAGTYEVNQAYLAPLFTTMFVDMKPARQTVTEVPYVPQFDDTERILFAGRWLQDGTATSVTGRKANPNVFHRIGGTQSPIKIVPGGYGAELGVTSVGGNANDSLIFDKRIQDLASGQVFTPTGLLMGSDYIGLDPFVINGETTAHETVHFWVHAGGVDNQGHCSEVSYRDPQLNCLMHTDYHGAGHADGIVDLHYLLNGADSEYMTVRRASDPVPQQ